MAARTELDVIGDQSGQAWAWLEETVSDVTAEQANWWPPGTANSSGTTYLHVVINTDVEVHRLVFDREPLVERDWAGDIGQGSPYDPAFFDRWHRNVDVDWPRLRGYGRAVHRAFTAVLDDLTAELLDRPIDMTRADLGVWQGRDMIALHGWNHVHIHGGEIAVLKGLQDGVGWAETEGFRNPRPFGRAGDA